MDQADWKHSLHDWDTLMKLYSAYSAVQNAVPTYANIRSSSTSLVSFRWGHDVIRWPHCSVASSEGNERQGYDLKRSKLILHGFEKRISIEGQGLVLTILDISDVSNIREPRHSFLFCVLHQYLFLWVPTKGSHSMQNHIFPSFLFSFLCRLRLLIRPFGNMVTIYVVYDSSFWHTVAFLY